MKQNKIWLWILIPVVVILVGGFFYFRYFSFIERYIGVNNNTQVNDLPEGVSVVERGGERFVRDERNGFEVKVEDENWDPIYISEYTLSIGPKEALLEGQEGFEITAYTSQQYVYDFKMWIDKWVSESNCPECYPTAELFEDNLYKVVDVGAMGDIINYFLLKDKNTVYMITLFDRSADIHSIIRNIDFDL